MVFTSMNSSVLIMVGWIFFFLWNLFDGVDGNVARYKEQYSKNGSLFDAVGGYLAMYFTFFAYGIAACNNPGYITEVLNINPIIYVILGSLSGFSLIFPRLVMHKKKTSSGDDGSVSNMQDKSSYGFIKKVVFFHKF